MSTELGFSMFQDVLFPTDQVGLATSEVEELRLRRLKRYVPGPDVDLQTTPIIIFDLESTGLDLGVDRIIEIGAIKYIGTEAVAEFSTLVHTDIELTEDIVKLTKITQDMLVGQPGIETVLPKFLDFIDGAILVAHNAEFDLGMIRSAAARLGIDLEWPCFCTVKLARELLPHLENRKLDTLAAYYGLTFEARHRAIGDIKVTNGVLRGLFAQEGSGLRRWAQMTNFVVN